MIQPNNIYLGDCYDLIKQIPDKSVDLIYTDIPYEMSYSAKGIFETKVKNKVFREEMKQKELTKGVNIKIYEEMVRVLKDIYIYIWCNNKQIFEILNYFVNIGCNYTILCWCKTSRLPFGSSPFLPDMEYCIAIYESNKKFINGWEHKSRWYISNMNQEDKRLFVHPTIKPLDLVKRHIVNTSKENDIVLDPFCGSGTTLKACKDLNRQYIGFEINPKYYQIAVDRLNNLNQRGEYSLF